MILAPSMLSADFGILAEQLEALEKSGCRWLHIDVMDGHFVSNISFGIPVVKSIRKYTNMFFDVHLMIENPEKYIEEFVSCGADGITFHAEAVDNIEKCAELIHSFGAKAAAAINPDTPAEAVIPYIDKLDMILAMSVYPGRGGQKYIESVSDKLRQIRKAAGENFLIEVDGGVSPSNKNEIINAGANVLVAGTAVFKGDIPKNVAAFMGE